MSVRERGHEDHDDNKVEIIVEGTPHLWTEERITYDQVVTLEVPDYSQNPQITYSVTYEKGPHENPEGILTKGDSVEVRNKMIFNVSETGQS
jgi:hypothetical protein